MDSNSRAFLFGVPLVDNGCTKEFQDSTMTFMHKLIQLRHNYHFCAYHYALVIAEYSCNLILYFYFLEKEEEEEEISSYFLMVLV